MGRLIRWIARTNAPAAVILVRLLVGCVFLSEGIQKFLFPEALGAGRFAKIGLAPEWLHNFVRSWPEWLRGVDRFLVPEVLAPFVGVCEIVCGCLLIVGLATRLAAIVMTINISVAIVSTKVPWLMEKGFWSMAHEARTDFCMFLGAIFLLIVGAGAWSLDHRIGRGEAESGQ